MSKFRKRLVDNAGFTLIELLVVIAVLGILAGIAIPRLTGVTDKAKLSEAKTSIGTIKNAMEMYYVENNTYDADGDTVVAQITSTHPLANYIEVGSLPSDWTYRVSSASDSSYTIYVDGTGDYSDLGAKIVKDSDVETTQNEADVGTDW